MADLPIVCTLSPAALAARGERLLPDLLRHADDHQERPEGHLLRFRADSETFAAIVHAVEAERHGCRFLRFQVTVDPDGGPIWLELTGPPGTREFLSALLDS